MLIVADLVLCAYLVLAVGKFNVADDSDSVCKEVGITITDQNMSGFLSAKEVKNMLTKSKAYPKGVKLQDVDPRLIESVLKKSSLIYDVECYKTPNGFVGINVSQRIPVIHIKSDDGIDTYLDSTGNEMTNSYYSSDLVVATGNINRAYARDYLALLGKYLLDHSFWNNQIEQINIRQDKSVELVPRIGDHIVCLGALPETDDTLKRSEGVNSFLDKKLARLDKLYRFGLNLSGWNKYDYINLEFDNQIICRKRHSKRDNIPT